MMAAITISSLLLVACVWGHVHAAAVNDTPNLGIIGGTVVSQITDVPYFARYRTKYTDIGCGASIISDRFLLTAAHCADKGFSGIAVGLNNRNDPVKIYDIENVFIHPGFNYVDGMMYDIAIIKLNEPLEFSDKVRPIKMADRYSKLKEGDQLLAMGFGSTNAYANQQSDLLLKLYMPLVNCMRYSIDTQHERCICAGGEAYKNVCNGDSGGPLVYKNILYGIASRSACGAQGFPAIFTSVPEMRGFIDYIIKKHA